MLLGKKMPARGLSAILDMGRASRLARARDLGFDTDGLYYHGSPGPEFDRFSRSGDRTRGDDVSGHYFTDDKETAERFSRENWRDQSSAKSGHVGSYYLRRGRVLDLRRGASIGPDAIGRAERVFGLRGLRRKLDRIGNDGEAFLDALNEKGVSGAEIEKFARDLGYDTIVRRRPALRGLSPFDETIVLDPKNIRRPGAAFDPKMSSSDLLDASFRD